MRTNILLLSWILLFVVGCCSAYLANRRGRNPVAWFLLGLCFGLIGLGVLLFLPPLGKEEEKDQQPDVVVMPARPVSEEMNKEWYFLDQNHKQQGPLGFLILKEKWREKTIDASTYVWTEGMSEWKRIRELQELEVNISF